MLKNNNKKFTIQEFIKKFITFESAEPGLNPNNDVDSYPEKDTFDYILGNIFDDSEDYKEVYDYYVSFLKSDSKNILTAGDNVFAQYLSNIGLDSAFGNCDELFKILNQSKARYSAVILLNTEIYLKRESLLTVFDCIFKQLERGGILIFEIADSVMCDFSVMSPEYIENLSKECGFKDVNFYKPPVEKAVRSSYVIVCRK